MSTSGIIEFSDGDEKYYVYKCEKATPEVVMPELWQIRRELGAISLGFFVTWLLGVNFNPKEVSQKYVLVKGWDTDIATNAYFVRRDTKTNEYICGKF